MIKLTLRVSKTDKDMIELIGVGEGCPSTLWAVFHTDRVYWDGDLCEALRSGEEVQMKLVKL
jgi:hypothetical protein